MVTQHTNVLPTPVVGNTTLNQQQPMNLTYVDPSAPPTNIPLPDTLPNVITQSQSTMVQEGPLMTPTSNTNKASMKTCHHELQRYLVLTQYCLPTQMSMDENKVNLCKFGRECLILKSKLQSLGRKLPDTPETVFAPLPGILKKYKYDVLDCTLMSCFQPDCKQIKSKMPKHFHFACYIHNISISNDEDLKMIEVENKDDPLLMLANQKNNMVPLEYNDIVAQNQKLVFPVCGKRCMSNCLTRRKEIQRCEDSKPSLTSNANLGWDKDGSDTVRSSEQVILDWLTTEENTSSYYGGVGKDGQTSANRKHSYHLKLSAEIEKENGSIRSPDAVRYKINFIVDTYKEAKERMENTGAGLEGTHFEKFQDYILAKVCKYYLELDPIFKNRPNVYPMFTNQDETDDEEEKLPRTYVLDDDDDDVIMFENNNDVSTNPYATSSYSSMNKKSNFDFSELTDDTRKESSSSGSEISCTKNNITSISTRVHNSSSSDCSAKLSPYKANLLRKSMLRDNKKQIHGKTKKLKNEHEVVHVPDERDYMMKCREKRLELEEKRDLRMEKIEEKKIKLEMERLMMDKTSTELKFESIRLHNMQEKKKLMLINMEVYEKRLKMKKEHPDLTDEFLSEMFPMD
jgi:hypothetical protein